MLNRVPKSRMDYVSFNEPILIEYSFYQVHSHCYRQKRKHLSKYAVTTYGESEQMLGCKYRVAPGTAVTGNEDNDTPVQSNAVREAG